MTSKPPAAARIVDYGMGNVRSVANALQAVGAEVSLASTPAALRGASHVILPGVGAFGDGMQQLREGGWVDALEEVRQTGTPVLGICLGMQLLLATGTEHGIHAGLGWIDGRVERLAGEGPQVRLPHVGWNEVRPAAPCRLFADVPEGTSYYFVHSYGAAPAEPASVTGTCEHGVPFVAAIHHANVHGVQFHPEKSHRAGLALLRAFLTLSREDPC